MTKELKTGIMYDECFNWHDTGTGALDINKKDNIPGVEWIEGGKWWYEGQDRIRPMMNLLERSRFTKELVRIEPREASREELLYAHTPEYIDKVKQLSDGEGGIAGIHTMIGRGSYEIIANAVGGTLKSLDMIMEGKIKNSYSLTRPPAGHAEREYGFGLCPINTYNILAYYARKKYGIKKIAIVDYDDHYKYGISNEWYEDPDTLYIEAHEAGTSVTVAYDTVGRGKGEGYTVPIGLPSGSGNDAYVRAFEEIVAPILDQFEPELIIVVSGFAANVHDMLCCQQVSSSG